MLRYEYKEAANDTKDYEVKKGCADGSTKLAVERWLETQPKETSNP